MAMKRDDAVLLKQIRKIAEMGIKAMETLFPKVEDAPFGRYLDQKELQYSQIRDRAKAELLRSEEDGGRTGAVSELMLRGTIHAETLFDTSISHVAELMIRGSGRGISELWKAMNRCENAGRTSRELAEELLLLEQKSITELKRYL